MLQLTSLTVDNYSINRNILDWSFTTTSGLLSDYSLSVYKSESPGISGTLTDYTLLASGIIPTDARYYDYSVSGLNSHIRTWYYKIYEETTSTLLTDYPYYANREPIDYAVREILLRKSLVMKRFVHRNLYLIKYRSWGDHCSRCWDDTLLRASDDKCPECYGLGWSGGYFTPVPIFGEIQQSPKYIQIQMFGEWHPSDIMLIMLHYPLIIPRDIIVDDKGKRWLAVQVRYTEKLGKVIEQNIQLSLIAYDDIVYTIPLPTTRNEEALNLYDKRY